MPESMIATGPAQKNVEAIYPLSPLQEGLLFHTVAALGSGIYVVQVDMTLEGDLDTVSFQRAWELVVGRHASLRTLFLWKGRSKPLQVVRRRVVLPWTQLDWRGLSPEEQDSVLADLVSQDRARGFTLTEAPVMRLVLSRTSERTWRLLWSFHHLILDGWSYAIVVREVFRAYQAMCHGENPALPAAGAYKEHISWLQKQDLSKAEEFWRVELKDFCAPTAFGVDRIAGATGSNGQHRRQRLELPPAVGAALRSFARQKRLTLNTVFQGAWAILLSRYSGEQDVVFGVTSSGRPDAVPHSEATVGLFINSTPLRAHVDPAAGLSAWLQDLQTRQLEARQHEHVPLTIIQKCSDVPAGSPLFESLLAFENYPREPLQELETDVIRVSALRYLEQMNFPLALQVFPDATIAFQLEYDSSRFDELTIGRMLGHLQTLLLAIITRPNLRLADLAILTEPERRQLLIDWNRTAAEMPCHISLQQLFEQQVARDPDQIAVVAGHLRLTYRELNQRANQLAWYLRRRGVTQGTLVGICLPRSVDMIVAVLATLKAGGAYVPIDPNHPSSRVKMILGDARAQLVITEDSLSERLQINSKNLLPLQAARNAIACESESNAAALNTPADLAYVLYTSGSTGRPKGVAIEHRSAVNFVEWAKAIFTSEELEGVLFSTSLCFDLSVFEMFVPLSSGGKIILADNVLQLRTLAAAGEVTLVNTVPSAMAELVKVDDWPAKVHTVNLAGEPLSNKLAQAIYSRPGVRHVYNLYGPTEATTYSTWVRVAKGAAEEPAIGRPIANTQAYILDPELNPVPVGVPGELYLGGAGLARGYLNRPDLTAERFIPSPFTGGGKERVYRTGDRARYRGDGNIEYLGRVDHQVKLRGFRIELSEIETVLGEHPAVSEVVVAVRDDENGTRQLVAYCVLNHLMATEELSTYLTERLPDYMVPRAFVILKSFPLTPNGKVDRRALPPPAESSPTEPERSAAPRTVVEEIVAAIWRDILHLKDVDIHANFFDLGGNSLDYFALLNRVEKEFGTSPTMEAVRRSPTIEQLARSIVQGGDSDTRNAAAATKLSSRVSLRDWFTHSQPWIELRQDLYKSIIQYGPVFRGFIPSYSMATRFLSWVSARWLLTSYLGARLLPLRKTISTDAYIGPREEAAVVRHSIFCNVWFLWRMAALCRSTPEEFDRWVTLRGFPAFQEACRQGGGVVMLTTHNQMRRVIFWLLHRAGLNDLDPVGEPDWDGQLERLGLPPIRMNADFGVQFGEAAYFPVRLYRAKETLKRGGIVWMAPDGFHGSSAGVTVPIFGRDLRVRTGFAELALDAGAKVAPVAVTLKEGGGLVVDFLPFLQASGSTHGDRVTSLVLQYADIIRKEWSENLGNANWTYLKIFVNSPEIQPKGPPGDQRPCDATLT